MHHNFSQTYQPEQIGFPIFDDIRGLLAGVGRGCAAGGSKGARHAGRRQTKVADLHVIVGTQEHVDGFQVAVDQAWRRKKMWGEMENCKTYYIENRRCSLIFLAR